MTLLLAFCHFPLAGIHWSSLRQWCPPWSLLEIFLFKFFCNSIHCFLQFIILVLSFSVLSSNWSILWTISINIAFNSSLSLLTSSCNSYCLSVFSMCLQLPCCSLYSTSARTFLAAVFCTLTGQLLRTYNGKNVHKSRIQYYLLQHPYSISHTTLLFSRFLPWFSRALHCYWCFHSTVLMSCIITRTTLCNCCFFATLTLFYRTNYRYYAVL